MSEEKIGGISLDDIMAAAMDGLDSNSSVSSETNIKKDIDVPPFKKSKNDSDLNSDASVGKKEMKNGAVVPNDIYTIGTVKLVNVTNRLTGTYEDMLVDVMSYLDENRTAEAMQLAQELVDHNMSNEVAWLIYAYAKQAWGDNALAQKGFEQAIAINPRFALALNDYGAFLLENEKVDMAMTYFNKALECDPKNVFYMRNVAYNLMFTDTYGAAIDKCEYFLSISDEKSYLENTLGQIYVEMCSECIIDVPIDPYDPSAGTEPGFIYLSDIREVREHCLKAKNLLTLEDFKDTLERCEYLLNLCDQDQYNTFRVNKMPYLIFHTIITILLYGILAVGTWGVLLPCLIIAPIALIKGNYFPMYMINYAYCTGTDDPLKYKEGSLRESMAQGFIDGWRSDGNNSFGSELALGFIQSRIWLLRSRFAFYKRFIQERKDKKKNSVDSIKTDDINSDK